MFLPLEEETVISWPPQSLSRQEWASAGTSSVGLPGNAPRSCHPFPHHLRDLVHDIESRSVGTRVDLALDRADAVVQPTVAGVVGRMHEAAEQPSHARVSEHRQPLPLEQDRGTVVGLEHPSELRHEHRVGPLPREVGRAVAGREAPGGTPLSQQEAASFDAGVCGDPTLQVSGVVKVTV
jgi:hypothetical protein